MQFDEKKFIQLLKENNILPAFEDMYDSSESSDLFPHRNTPLSYNNFVGLVLYLLALESGVSINNAPMNPPLRSKIQHIKLLREATRFGERNIKNDMSVMGLRTAKTVFEYLQHNGFVATDEEHITDIGRLFRQELIECFYSFDIVVAKAFLLSGSDDIKFFNTIKKGLDYEVFHR
jgi:hypothetical protein